MKIPYARENFDSLIIPKHFEQSFDIKMPSIINKGSKRLSDTLEILKAVHIIAF